MVKQLTHIVRFCALISAILAMSTLAATTDIYKSVDKNGVVTFSDVPPVKSAGTQNTTIKPNATNSMPGLSSIGPDQGTVTSDAPAPKTVSIASPENNATIPMGAGIFDVTAELGAPLVDGELLALYLDDDLVNTPQTSNVWTLTYVIRGPHTLQVRRLSSTGATVSESEVITIFVLRPSVLRGAPR